MPCMCLGAVLQQPVSSIQPLQSLSRGTSTRQGGCPKSAFQQAPQPAALRAALTGAGQLAGTLTARSQREARLLNTIKALQLALQRAAHQAAGNAPSNLKYMQVCARRHIQHVTRILL